MSVNWNILQVVLYILPLALLGYWINACKIRQSIKVVLIVLLPLLYLLNFYVFKQLLGWSTPYDLPDDFDLIAYKIAEPRQGSGESGAIYLWLESASQLEPRGYEVPYSRDLHKKLIQVSESQKQGRKIEGTSRSKGSRISNFNSGRELSFEEKKKKSLPEKE